MSTELTDEMIEGLENVTAATEDLFKSLQKMTKSMGDTSKVRKDEFELLGESVDSFDALNDSVRNSDDEIDRYTKTIAFADEILEDMGKGMKRAAVTLDTMVSSTMKNADSFDMYRSMIDPATDLMKNLGSVVGSVAGGIVKFGAGLPFMEGVFNGMAGATDKAITGITAMAAGITNFVLKKGLEATEQLWDMFEGATEAGVLVTGGMTEMRRQQGELELTTTEYTAFLNSQKEALAQFGGSVGEGAKQMASVAKYSRQYEREMRALGVTWQDQAEMQSEFFSRLQRTGQLAALDDQQKAASAAEYIKSLKALSALTGESVDQLTAEADEKKKDIAAQANLAKFTGGVRDQMQILHDTGLPGFDGAIKEMMATGGSILQDVVVLQTGLDKPLKELYGNITSCNMTTTEAVDDFNKKLRNDFPDLLEELNGRFSVASLAQMYGANDEVTAEITESYVGVVDAFNRAMTGEDGITESMKNIGEEASEGTKEIIDAQKAARKTMADILEIAEENMPIITGLMKGTAKTMQATFSQAKDILDDPSGWAQKMIDMINPMDMLNTATGGASNTLLKFNEQLKELTGGKGWLDLLAMANPVAYAATSSMDAIDAVKGWFSDDDDDLTPEQKTRKTAKREMETKQVENQEELNKLNRNIEAMTFRRDEEQARINRSNTPGVDEYWGSEESGRSDSQAMVDRLNETLNQLILLQKEQNRKLEENTEAVDRLG